MKLTELAEVEQPTGMAVRKGDPALYVIEQPGRVRAIRDGRLDAEPVLDLASVVGAQGILFNGGYNKAMYAFGFPAAAPYDGTKLIYCSGNSGKDFLLSKDHGLGCNMTGGSSGGPWFDNFSESDGTGVQVSVNSFGYTGEKNAMYGPYFGSVIEGVYDAAQSAA